GAPPSPSASADPPPMGKRAPGWALPPERDPSPSGKTRVAAVGVQRWTARGAAAILRRLHDRPFPPQSSPAGGGPAHGGTPPRPGGGGLGQDPSDRASQRPPHRPRRSGVGDPGGDLHQQGGG